MIVNLPLYIKIHPGYNRFAPHPALCPVSKSTSFLSLWHRPPNHSPRFHSNDLLDYCQLGKRKDPFQVKVRSWHSFVQKRQVKVRSWHSFVQKISKEFYSLPSKKGSQWLTRLHSGPRLPLWAVATVSVTTVLLLFPQPPRCLLPQMFWTLPGMLFPRYLHGQIPSFPLVFAQMSPPSHGQWKT